MYTQLQMEIHVKFIASMVLCTLLCSLVGTLLNLIHLPFPFSLSSLVSQLHLYQESKKTQETGIDPWKDAACYGIVCSNLWLHGTTM